MNQLLASILDKFKTQNPKAFAALGLVLVVVYAGLESDYFQTLFGVNALAAKVMEYVAFALALLAGSHTSHISKDGK